MYYFNLSPQNCCSNNLSSHRIIYYTVHLTCFHFIYIYKHTHMGQRTFPKRYKGILVFAFFQGSYGKIGSPRKRSGVNLVEKLRTITLYLHTCEGKRCLFYIQREILEPQFIAIFFFLLDIRQFSSNHDYSTSFFCPRITQTILAFIFCSRQIQFIYRVKK